MKVLISSGTNIHEISEPGEYKILRVATHVELWKKDSGFWRDDAIICEGTDDHKGGDYINQHYLSVRVDEDKVQITPEADLRDTGSRGAVLTSRARGPFVCDISKTVGDKMTRGRDRISITYVPEKRRQVRGETEELKINLRSIFKFGKRG